MEGVEYGTSWERLWAVMVGRVGLTPKSPPPRIRMRDVWGNLGGDESRYWRGTSDGNSCPTWSSQPARALRRGGGAEPGVRTILGAVRSLDGVV